MAWFDTDVRFDDGGLGIVLASATRRVDDLRDRRAREVRRACRSWEGGARAAFDDDDRRVDHQLAALADALRSASTSLQAQSEAAARDNRRRAELRQARDHREQVAREAAERQAGVQGRLVA